MIICFLFKDALPHPGWNGILNATSNSKVCAQGRNGQEDCLVVNVYTPVVSVKNNFFEIQIKDSLFVRYCK